ncbi:MAG: LytTR family DNA-binding domain-containing protein [Bacteroidia bacterium]|nr:LytTR family DNA-binding domain-containing protein [Bacteroidia bacterium]
MNKKLDQLIYLLKKELGHFLSISLGVFLFVLFFQPFPLDRFDFNNRLLFVAGLGAIVFLFMVLVRIVFPWLIQNSHQSNNEHILPSYIGGFIILALSSVAFAFYMRYVGLVSISFYIIIKVVLICLTPTVVLSLCDAFKELKEQNESFIKEKKIIQKQIKKYEEDYLNKSIEFISDNSTEKLNLLIADVAFIKSADNYVEIVYKEGDNFKKKLIRNTLKNIEQQIKPYSNFIRCHRICIVNLYYIEKLKSNYNDYWLTIKGYNEQIPVSRQYLLKIKEAI